MRCRINLTDEPMDEDGYFIEFEEGTKPVIHSVKFNVTDEDDITYSTEEEYKQFLKDNPHLEELYQAPKLEIWIATREDDILIECEVLEIVHYISDKHGFMNAFEKYLRGQLEPTTKGYDSYFKVFETQEKEFDAGIYIKD